MKTNVLFAVVVVALFFASCEKIRLNRLEGFWELETWKLEKDNGTSINGLTFFPVLTGEEVVLEFTNDGRSLLVVFDNDTLRYADSGRWTYEDNVNTLIYSDSVVFFNPDVAYDIEKLTKAQLLITGPFTHNGTVYQSTLELKGN